MICLDTSAILDALGKGGPARQQDVAALLRRLNPTKPCCTTRINVAELQIGAELSPHPFSEYQMIDDFLQTLNVLEFDRSSALAYVKIFVHLRRIGRPVGDRDAIIASIALSNNCTFITRNVRHFENVPALMMESY
ncbi:MAG TPA: type II toxin-antitoxin system VapC family toxin [Tepidisphaeraceae bacterium]|nr:type II toxin-antitoxin system VapC family toxin [Tepidisphaeraceae bacterium]